MTLEEILAVPDYRRLEAFYDAMRRYSWGLEAEVLLYGKSLAVIEAGIAASQVRRKEEMKRFGIEPRRPVSAEAQAAYVRASMTPGDVLYEVSENMDMAIAARGEIMKRIALLEAMIAHDEPYPEWPTHAT